MNKLVRERAQYNKQEVYNSGASENRYSDELWNIIKMLLSIDPNKRADCDMILNNRFIKNKINELDCLDIRDNIFVNNKNKEDDSSML